MEGIWKKQSVGEEFNLMELEGNKIIRLLQMNLKRIERQQW
jgi:hypothetical protein